MTYRQEFEEAMTLVEQISEVCDGADLFEMMYALTMLQTELLVEMESVSGHKFEPQLAKLFSDLLNDARESRQLNDMDETEATAH